MSIAHGHLDCLVPHQLLNRPDRGALHSESAGEGVPQTVPSEVCDVRFLHCWFKPVPSTLQGFAALIDEYRILTVRPFLQLLQGSVGGSIYRDVARFTVLAQRYGKHAIAEVHILPGQPVLFTATDTSIQRNLQFGQMLRILVSNRLPKPSLLLRAEKPDAAIVLQPSLHESSWILLDLAVLHSQTESERQ